MSDYFWTEVVAIAIYIMNRTPTASIHDMMPEEKYTSRKLDISHLVALLMFISLMRGELS